MQSQTINIDGQDITLYIQRKRIRNLYLRVKENGNLYCTVPYGTDDYTILKFVYSRKDWIQKVQVKQHRQSAHNEEGVHSPFIYIFNEKKYVRYVESTRNKVEIEGDILTFYLKEITDEQITKTFRKYASRVVQDIINTKRIEWDTKICDANYLPHPTIKVRYMTSRWGVCYPTKNMITLSNRLIHYPIESLEYVLLHEYTHLLVQNHSKKFYAIVKRFMPEYKKYDQYLKG